MNELLPDWMHHEDITRAVPNLSTNAEHPTSTIESQLREQLRVVKEENIALRADIAKLEAENAELREKCMTNMERIQTADEYGLATMLLGIHGWGYTDAYEERGGSPFFDFDSPEDVIHWLKRTEWD